MLRTVLLCLIASGVSQAAIVYSGFGDYGATINSDGSLSIVARASAYFTGGDIPVQRVGLLTATITTEGFTGPGIARVFLSIDMGSSPGAMVSGNAMFADLAMLSAGNSQEYSYSDSRTFEVPVDLGSSYDLSVYANAYAQGYRGYLGSASSMSTASISLFKANSDGSAGEAVRITGENIGFVPEPSTAGLVAAAMLVLGRKRLIGFAASSRLRLRRS